MQSLISALIQAGAETYAQTWNERSFPRGGIGGDYLLQKIKVRISSLVMQIFLLPTDITCHLPNKQRSPRQAGYFSSRDGFRIRHMKRRGLFFKQPCIVASVPRSRGGGSRLRGVSFSTVGKGLWLDGVRSIIVGFRPWIFMRTGQLMDWDECMRRSLLCRWDGRSSPCSR